MLGTVIHAAVELLQSPGAAPPDCLASVLRATDRVDRDLILIAAAIYARPELLPADLPSRLTRVLVEPSLPPHTVILAARVLEFLIATPLAPSVIEPVLALAAQPGFPAEAYTHCCAILEYAAWWSCALLDPCAVVCLAEAAHLRPHRELLSRRVLEPALYGAGASIDTAILNRTCRLFAGQPSLPYLLYRITHWRQFSAAVREAARAACPAFPYQQEAACRLSGEGCRVLVIHNIKDGQGDEIVRWLPLVQGFLDFNPHLTVVVVSRRAYIAAHPRVTSVPIGDRQAVEEALGQRFDVVLDFFESVVVSLNHDPGLELRIQEYVRERRPFFFASSLKGADQNLFERADLDGRLIAQARGLNMQRAASIYEPASRLIAELGLPLRSGQDSPSAGFVLAGIEWPEAWAAWLALVERNTGARPVALFNPFGGNLALKGFVPQTFDAAAAEIERLTAEGYFVVLLPNGTAWGTVQAALEVAGRLSAECCHHLAIAEDPAAPAQSQTLHDQIPGAPPLLHADFVTRQFFYFVSYADLIVTVEGWLVHTAWCLGKPYRLMLAPLSQREQWSPYARTALQSVQCVPALPSGQLHPASPPPLVEQPRKSVLEFLMREFGRAGDPAVLPMLRHVVSSPDRDLRRAAAEGLAALSHADTVTDLLPLLEDPWNAVRAVAANGLLQRRDGVPVSQAELLGHVYIGQYGGRDWRSVVVLGEAAWPAVRAAMKDDDEVVRREACDASRRLEIRIRVEREARENSPGGGIPEAIRLLLSPRSELVPPPPTRLGTILILTPVKDAAHTFGGYCERLRRLTYPRKAISLGFLESDSQDATFRAVSRQVRRLRREFRRAALWKRDFGYQIPPFIHRSAAHLQAQRRAILARSRNHLLLHALDDEEWVLWLDVDVIEYPPDIIERLLAAGRDLVQPHCVIDYGGRTYDNNAWFDQGRFHLEDLRSNGDLVELDAVGGTMLLVRADLHRDGLVFPPFPYGKANPRVRAERGGELETEGLGIMAQDMGHRCWGMPNLEIRHERW
jgi:hypothetical protein